MEPKSSSNNFIWLLTEKKTLLLEHLHIRRQMKISSTVETDFTKGRGKYSKVKSQKS